MPSFICLLYRTSLSPCHRWRQLKQTVCKKGGGISLDQEDLGKDPNSRPHCPTIWVPCDMKLKKSLTRIDNDVYHHQHSKICISRAHLGWVDRVVGDQWQWDDYHREGALCSGQIRNCSVARWPLRRRLLSYNHPSLRRRLSCKPKAR